jgi:hypothetical protein
MSLIKKSDVKNHLSARHQTHIHIAPEPDATGFSGTDQPSAERNFSADFTGDHTTTATPDVAPAASTSELTPHAPAETRAEKA